MPRPTPPAPKATAGQPRPSVLALLPVLGAGWLAVAVARLPILTPDVWWHLATGRVIATSGIPHRDPFSYTLGTTPWTVHEWLADRVLYAVESHGGLLGVVTLRAVLLVCAAALAYRLARRHAGRGVALACIAAAAYASQRNWLDRPQLWSYALMPLLLLLLDLFRQRPSRWAWVLPGLFAIWVNLHGGFMLGLAVVALWAACDVWEARRAGGVAVARIRRNLALLAACALATLLNPNGWRGAVYPLHYVGTGLAATIREERPGNLDSPYAWVHVLLVAALLSLLAMRWRRVPLAHRATGLLLAALSLPRLAGIALPFAAERHAPLFLFGATPILAWQIDAWRNWRRGAGPARFESWLSSGPVWTAAVVLAGFALWQMARALPRDPDPAVRLLPGGFRPRPPPGSPTTRCRSACSIRIAGVVISPGRSAPSARFGSTRGATCTARRACKRTISSTACRRAPKRRSSRSCSATTPMSSCGTC